MSIGFDFAGEVQRYMGEEELPRDIAASATLDAYGANLRLFDAMMAFIRRSTPFDDGGGCMVVAATGNESRRDRNRRWSVAASVPSAAEGILSVGAVGKSARRLTVAPFSNSSPKLVAPGVDVLSAAAGTSGMVCSDGTSMACPHVAGAATLWWQALDEGGGAQPELVSARLLAGARTGPILARDGIELRGAGLVTCP